MKTDLSKIARLSVEYRSVSDLTPYSGNARKHPKSQIRKIAQSLKKFGWTNPILIDADGVVLCGHGRLEAAKLINQKTVPVIPLGQLSEADRKAYIIADNRIAEEAEWSKSTLRNELSGLAELGYDLELTGFDTLEIDTVLSIGDDPIEEDEVEVPDEGAQPISRLGDLWEIGAHRLLVGDARDKEAYNALLQGEKAELVITDPPYGCVIANNVSGGGRVKHGNFVMGAGETDLTEFAGSLLRPAF